jgi:imidazolonepropionase-like amidohydrolase
VVTGAREPLTAISDVRVYADPDANPVDHCTVVIEGSRVARIEPNGPIPAGARVLSGRGQTLVAGFWNVHVHLTESFWARSRRAPPAEISHRLREMFTRRGFTSVVDLGSDARISLRIRSGLQNGTLEGPHLYTSGTPIYPPKGIPFYVRSSVPRYLHWALPQPTDPRGSERAANRTLDRGCDVLKLFTGSYVERDRILPMREPIARAAVGAAHARGRLVFAHPSNLAGTLVALNSEVDVLAHAPSETEGIEDSLLQRIVDRGMSMVPTLKMFATTVTTSPSYLEPIYSVVRRFRAAGGDLLFGTDVGYMTDYSTDGEFDGLVRTGMGWRDILRMLTTRPAQRFRADDRLGAVTAGREADLVLLNGDPADDVLAFSRVSTTIRSGQVLWEGR